MFPKMMKHRLMNEAGAGGGDGGGGTGGGAGSDAGSVAGAAGADAGAQGGAGASSSSVLAAGAAGAAAAGASEWAAPEKYLVKNDAGEVDWKATAQKIDGGRSSFEKRFGSGDVPPAEVAGYKINVPEGVAETLKEWDHGNDPKLKGFLENAHKAHMTQAQIDVVIGQYASIMAEAKAAGASAADPEAARAAAAETCSAELAKVWKDQAEFDKNIGEAYKAADKLAQRLGMSFADLEAAGLGDNPTFIRIAAALAPEMGEDTPVGTQGSGSTSGGWRDEVAALKAEKNALPERDPRRDTVQAKINQLYEKHTPKA